VDDGVERPASLLLALLQAVAPADVAFIAPARATWHHRARGGAVEGERACT
jgi:hypothetical protein